MAGIFKAYDVRGVYPIEIDEAGAGRIGPPSASSFPRPISPPAGRWWSAATCARTARRSPAAADRGAA